MERVISTLVYPFALWAWIPGYVIDTFVGIKPLTYSEFFRYWKD